MRFHSAVSDAESTAEAVRRVVAEARDGLDEKIDVAFVFFTDAHRDDAESIAETVWLELDPQAVVGCSAEGVIGADREGERAAGPAAFAGPAAPARALPL